MANKIRSDIATWGAIAIGLVLGYLLKRVRFGMIFGILFGIVIVYMMHKKMKIK